MAVLPASSSSSRSWHRAHQDWRKSVCAHSDPRSSPRRSEPTSYIGQRRYAAAFMHLVSLDTKVSSYLTSDVQGILMAGCSLSCDSRPANGTLLES
jgi:hypothetical protein